MDIKRKAILIGAPNVTPRLPGVIIDVNHIKNFLMSNTGGAWQEDEITILMDPTKQEVTGQLILAQSADYVFISCSGHGEHQVGKGLADTAIYLNEDETMPIGQINPKNKRHLVVVDVCRNVVEISEHKSEALLKSSFCLESAKNIDFRDIFNSAVMACSEGRIVAYSCDVNQSAGDDGKGGVFTQELLKTPSAFNNTNYPLCNVINIYDSFNVAKEITYARNAPQSPVIDAGRRRDFFPFALVY